MFAVNAGAVATPLAFVVTVLDPPNVPLAPVAGAVNVTVAPLTGFPLPSFTVAASTTGNGVLIVTLCGVVPATGVMVAGGPATFVRLNVTGASAPVVAVTV